MLLLKISLDQIHEQNNWFYCSVQEEQLEEDANKEKRERQERLQAFQKSVVSQLQTNKEDMENINRKLDDLQAMMKSYIEKTSSQ